MTSMAKVKTVVSLGGSLIVPETIDSSFLKKFRSLVLSYVAKRQFFIVAGGGHTARHYRDGGNAITELSENDLHWLGIHATRLNAQLVRIIFGTHAHPEVLHGVKNKQPTSYSVVVGGGGEPGWTTDHVAVEFAQQYGAKEVLNLSDIDFLYDKDPRKYKDAQPIHKIGWKEFLKMFTGKMMPGFHGPFDPVAAKLAQKLGIRVVVLNGNNLKNLKNYLDGKKFVGTVIE